MPKSEQSSSRLERMIAEMNLQEVEERERDQDPALMTLLRNPLYPQIVRMLAKYPLLVPATLNWLLERESLMAAAQLQVLFTEEQLSAMRKQRVKAS